jgi:multisubunit Na+/H+ antiporter MnhE subunit
MRRFRSLLAWALALFGLWLVLVGTVAWLELVAGACAAAIGAVAATVVGERGLLRYGMPAHMLLQARRPLLRIVPDFWLLVVALVRAAATGRRPSGAYRAMPYPAGDPGARAFATAAGSLAPNSVVVDIDADRDLMLVHTLVPGGPTRPL